MLKTLPSANLHFGCTPFLNIIPTDNGKGPVIFENWLGLYQKKVYLMQVKIEMFDSSGHQVMWMEFDARGTSKSTWFNATKLISSSYETSPSNSKSYGHGDCWSDNIFKSSDTYLKRVRSTIFCSRNDIRRVFYIANEVSCGGDELWTKVIDASGIENACYYENIASHPRFYYSDLQGPQNAACKLRLVLRHCDLCAYSA